MHATPSYTQGREGKRLSLALRLAVGMAAAGGAMVLSYAPVAYWLVFAAFVVVPVGLEVAGGSSGERSTLLHGRVRILAMVAALPLWFALRLDAGPLAAGLSAPWLFACAVISGSGALRCVRRGFWPLHELCFDAGLAYLLVGGVWLMASRLLAAFMGFSEPWMSLTAVHFHTAAFAVPIMIGAIGRALTSEGLMQRWRWVYAPSALIAVASPVAVAIGITVRGVVELAAAMAFVMALVAAAALQLGLVLRSSRGAAAILLALSGLGLLAGALLAGTYAITLYTGASWLRIDQMVASHGAINAVFSCFAGLLGWILWFRARRDAGA